MSGSLCRVEHLNRQLKRATWVLVFATMAANGLIVPSNAEAAIAVDGIPSEGTTTTATASVPHTTGSGSNRLMMVGISFTDQGTVPAIQSVKYNDIDLNRVGGVGGGQSTSDDYARVEIWYLKMPDTGTHNVVVTFATAPDDATVGVMTFTGVDQTTPLGTFTSATADSDTASTTVTSAVGELVFDTMVLEASGDTDLVPEASQTERWDIYQASRGNGAGSTEPGAASVGVLC